MAKASVALGEVFAFPLVRGGWGACQVVRVEAKDVEVVALDHFGDERPRLGVVRRSPLVLDSYFSTSEPVREHVTGAPPEDFVSLGVCGPVVPRDPPSNTYAHWESVRSSASRHRQWRGFPEASRAAFRASIARKEKRSLALPNSVVKVSEHTSSLLVATGSSLSPLHAFRAPDPAGFDWRVFDALPCLTSVEVWGDAPGLIAWLATRPIVRELTWHGVSQPSLDLSGLSVDSVSVAPRGPCDLSLPPTLESLTLRGDDRSAVTAHVPDAATPLALTVETRDGRSLALLTGASKATSLRVASFASFDCAALAGFTSLRSLELNSQNGALTGVAHLASLTGLRSLTIRTCRSIDVERMPPLSAWPSMTRLLVWGARDTDAARLKELWGRTRDVSVTAQQKTSWLATHPSHPMMHWPHYAGAAQVCGAFSTAMRSLVAGRDPANVLPLFARSIERIEVTRTAPYSADERADIAAAWDVLVAHVADAEARERLASQRPPACTAPSTR